MIPNTIFQKNTQNRKESFQSVHFTQDSGIEVFGTGFLQYRKKKS